MVARIQAIVLRASEIIATLSQPARSLVESSASKLSFAQVLQQQQLEKERAAVAVSLREELSQLQLSFHRLLSPDGSALSFLAGNAATLMLAANELFANIELTYRSVCPSDPSGRLLLFPVSLPSVFLVHRLVHVFIV